MAIMAISETLTLLRLAHTARAIIFSAIQAQYHKNGSGSYTAGGPCIVDRSARRHEPACDVATSNVTLELSSRRARLPSEERLTFGITLIARSMHLVNVAFWHSSVAR